MVPSAGSGWVRSPSRSCVECLSTTISDIIVRRYSSLFLLLRRSCNVSYHERECITPFSRLIQVPFDYCAFATSVTMGFKVGLPRNYHVDYGIVLPKCVLRILLFSRVTASLLDDGTHMKFADADILIRCNPHICNVGR